MNHINVAFVSFLKLENTFQYVLIVIGIQLELFLEKNTTSIFFRIYPFKQHSRNKFILKWNKLRVSKQ